MIPWVFSLSFWSLRSFQIPSSSSLTWLPFFISRFVFLFLYTLVLHISLSHISTSRNLEFFSKLKLKHSSQNYHNICANKCLKRLPISTHFNHSSGEVMENMNKNAIKLHFLYNTFLLWVLRHSVLTVCTIFTCHDIYS